MVDKYVRSEYPELVGREMPAGTILTSPKWDYSVMGYTALMALTIGALALVQLKIREQHE